MTRFLLVTTVTLTAVGILVIPLAGAISGNSDKRSVEFDVSRPQTFVERYFSDPATQLKSAGSLVDSIEQPAVVQIRSDAKAVTFETELIIYSKASDGFVEISFNQAPVDKRTAVATAVGICTAAKIATGALEEWATKDSPSDSETTIAARGRTGGVGHSVVIRRSFNENKLWRCIYSCTFGGKLHSEKDGPPKDGRRP